MTADPGQPNDLPTIAVPDLNGRHDRFELVLKAYPPDQYRYVLLGDIIDQGPDTPELIQTIRKLQREQKIDIIAGNHEELMINAVFGPPNARRQGDLNHTETPEFQRWIRNGGGPTIRSYRNKQTLISDAQWLRDHARRWIIRSPWLYSHATRPGPDDQHVLTRQLQDGSNDPLLWARPARSAELHPLRADLKGSVHGHSPQQAPNMIRGLDRKPAWFIDLGTLTTAIAVHCSEHGTIDVLKPDVSQDRQVRPSGRGLFTRLGQKF